MSPLGRPGLLRRSPRDPRRPSTTATLVAAFAGMMALAASCQTGSRRGPVTPGRQPSAAPPAAPAPTPVPVADSLVIPPVVRVGLHVEVARATLTAESGVIVRVPDGSRTRDVPLARATFVAVEGGASGTRFRVQLGSFTDERSASELAGRAREAAGGLAPTVRWNDETRSYQVRIGEMATREEAQAFVSRLARVGMGGGWVVEETMSAAPGRVRLVQAREELPLATVLPAAAGELLSVDGVPYRGVFEVRPGGEGIVVVNVLNIEDYLRGVVPNELSPHAFPALEALKAQAIAARTYVLRNRGGYRAQGYDICATPACQVYRGRSTEHPLADRAVQETRGLAAFHRGQLINALYTSTCGGHTETGSNIFEGEATPYLLGVSCAPEREAWTTLKSASVPGPLGDEPGLVRSLAVLEALGVVDLAAQAAALSSAPTDRDLRDWVGRLAEALQRRDCPARTSGPVTRRATFFQYVVDSLCWTERGRRLLPEHDQHYVLSVEDRAALDDEAERRATALLIHERVLEPFPDNTVRPDAAITRPQALGLLAAAALAARPNAVVDGLFQGAGEEGIRIETGGETKAYAFTSQARLFRALDGSRLAASQLNLAVGDRVRAIARDGALAYLEADQSLLAASSDRTSRVFKWDVRLTPKELAAAVARYGSVGEVRDVLPRKHGVSGRVTELAVQGTDGELVLRGLRVRWGLGLRENLFTIERERDASGAVQRFVFSGKGWGHGVGLCQVGSFGMAQAGSRHDRILQHYYSGITLAQAY
ncbi:MAG TPA: SpoIID/LytB domain-containing protein [Vicinamibacteria bacterium]|nr:SpoIID/LytB domain-containing protein [Vicinamibacteria bacterium]